MTLATTYSPIIFPFLALCVLVELFVSLKNEFTHWCSRNYILKYLSICLKSLEFRSLRLIFKVKLLYPDLNRERRILWKLLQTKLNLMWYNMLNSFWEWWVWIMSLNKCVTAMKLSSISRHNSLNSLQAEIKFWQTNESSNVIWIGNEGKKTNRVVSITLFLTTKINKMLFLWKVHGNFHAIMYLPSTIVACFAY